MPFAPDALFQLANTLALAAWVALAVAVPGRRFTRTVWLVTGRVLPLLFAAAYVALLATSWPAGGGFGSLAAVRVLFDAPAALLAGWLHYLAFDLFVGTWIAQHAARVGMPRLAVLPVLALTFLFGPAGLLVHFALQPLLAPAPSTASLEVPQ